MRPVIDDPILNSPFAEPARHWVLDENGVPTGAVEGGRRRSEFIVPVPPPRHRVAAQETLEFEDEYGERRSNDYINEIRGKVGAWRTLGDEGLRAVTPVTARLIRHWRDPSRTRRQFFCQIEAVETAIWLSEIAPKLEIDRLRALNEAYNPELFRIAFKLATGAGKTTIMGMLIAWQTLNAATSQSRRFTDRFLVIAPGITVRDRLRVLKPSDPDNIYTDLDLVPREMRDTLQRARVEITNYHAFKKRETLEATKLAKEIIAGRHGVAERPETDGEMVQRVCKDVLGGKRVLVLNDEAHHCYREKPAVGPGKKRGDAEGSAEAKRNNEAARLWISGIEALQRVLGEQVTVYDLSATPFFLRGSGEEEGTLFPWVVSDFSLIDAIECGIVKTPRVPVQDVPGADTPVYRNIYRYIQDNSPIKLPRAGRKQGAGDLDPDRLPPPLVGALEALYGHYRKIFENWVQEGSATPPVFIVVCNNTATSKLVFDWISGYERIERTAEGEERRVLVRGQLPLFSNVEGDGQNERRFSDRPVTVLIDSEELESGDALSADFRKLAGAEIEAFKRDLRIRGRGAEAEKLTDADLLREVMNTVGKAGRLGERIRCVVSVSMLTEGWDARTVKHVLGVRAFGTQLLCEQVIGRALRRVSYDPVGVDEAGNPMYAPEYAEILGIPFTFIPANSAPDYQPPKKLTQVYAVPGREVLEIRFPRVIGYRTLLPPGRLVARFSAESRMTIDPTDAPPEAINAAIVGKEEKLSLAELKEVRFESVAFHLAGHTLRQPHFRDSEDALKPWLFPALLSIVRRWMNGCLSCVGGTFPAYLLWRGLADRAAEKIYRACLEENGGTGVLRAILDPYNETGSTRYVKFSTTKTNFFEPRAERSQINLIVCDKDWEAAAAQALNDMGEVLRFVKNDHLGFEVPYVSAGNDHQYRPDFVVVVNDGHGPDDPLHLVVEVKGQQRREDEDKHDTMKRLWVPAVNNAGRFGRWDFCRVDGPYGVDEAIRRHLAGRERVAA